MALPESLHKFARNVKIELLDHRYFTSTNIEELAQHLYQMVDLVSSAATNGMAVLCCFPSIPWIAFNTLATRYQRKLANNPESLPKKKKPPQIFHILKPHASQTRSAFSSRYFRELRLEIYTNWFWVKKLIHVVQVPRHLRDIEAATYMRSIGSIDKPHWHPLSVLPRFSREVTSAEP